MDGNLHRHLRPPMEQHQHHSPQGPWFPSPQFQYQHHLQLQQQLPPPWIPVPDHPLPPRPPLPPPHYGSYLPPPSPHCAPPPPSWPMPPPQVTQMYGQPDQVFVFGSFTEDETRLFQKDKGLVEASSEPVKKTELRFGSLDYGAVTGIQSPKKSDQSGGSKSCEPAKPFIENGLPKNKSKSVDVVQRSSTNKSDIGHPQRLPVNNGEEACRKSVVNTSSVSHSAQNGSVSLKPSKKLLLEEMGTCLVGNSNIARKATRNSHNALEVQKHVNGASDAKHYITKMISSSLQNLNMPSGFVSNTVEVANKSDAISGDHSVLLSEGLEKLKREGHLENHKHDYPQNPEDETPKGGSTAMTSDANTVGHLANGLAAEKDMNKTSNGIGETFKHLQPRGLINLGNLCFLNATLQALLSCSLFVQLLQKLKARDIPKMGYPTLRAFTELISEFELSKDLSARKNMPAIMEVGKPFSPAMFEAVLKKFTPDLPCSISGRPRQEDAQEFLSFVMYQMHDELLKLQGNEPFSDGGKSSLVSSAEDDDWETVGPKNKTAVVRTQSFVPSELSNIFGGQLRSVVKAKGIKPSATVQPFLLLHLDILLDAVHTIADALRLFSAQETLEDYRTSAGKSGVVSAQKSVKIQTLSKIMILHLMRFSYGSLGSTKLHKPVRFPLELALGRELLVSSTSEGRRYELVATITHIGRDPSRGHYVADAKHVEGKWLRFDDASVSVVTVNEVLHDQAYVLFYQQV